MPSRKAASLIELVFAIVIMGLAMTTLPMMLTRVQKNNTFAMQQEAILIARTQIGDIITYPWDENSFDDSYNVGILDTDGDTDFNRTNRVGLINANKRRKFFTNNTPATYPLVKESTDIDDIDDFNTKNQVLTAGVNTNSTLGYKLSDSNMTINVNYIADTTTFPTPGTFNFNTTSLSKSTNIKMIEVSLQNGLLDKNITLRTFSSNIGANQLLRRTF